MRFPRARIVHGALALVLVLTSAALAQRGYRRVTGGNRWSIYEGEMQDPVNDPPDALRRGEWAFGRLRYRSPLDRGFGRYARWGIDANKGDRSFLTALTRLTRLNTQPIETIIDIDDDEIFNWPWIFAVSAGDWQLSPTQAARLRKYFDRGGFLFVDDFHNEQEWATFMDGIHQIRSTAVARDLGDSDAAFHVMFDLTQRLRVVGANVVDRPPAEQNERGGRLPAWRGIFDDRERMQVAISFNQDVGDAWEFADDPNYPEKLTTEGIRLGINYVIYAMTH
jgi:hypothetical protein